MKKQYFTKTQQQKSQQQTTDNKSSQLKIIKIRSLFQQNKKSFRKNLFGDHYNHSKVHLNKQKKYLLEEQKNTQIQKNNRILLQKIQHISKRSVHLKLRKRMFTQVDDQQFVEVNQSKNLINKIKSNDQGHYSHHKLVKIGQIRQKSNYSKNQKKVLFDILKTIDNKSYRILGQIQNNTYNLSISIGSLLQKIKIDLKHYRNIYKQILQYKHSNISQFLQCSHGHFQLCGIDNKLIIKEDILEKKLPLINNKKILQKFKVTISK